MITKQRQLSCERIRAWRRSITIALRYSKDYARAAERNMRAAEHHAELAVKWNEKINEEKAKLK